MNYGKKRGQYCLGRKGDRRQKSRGQKQDGMDE